MTAVRAEAVELKSVGFNGKSVPGGHLFLEPLNVAVLKLYDLSAVGTNKVVVVALVGNIVILGLGAEVAGLCEAGIAEQIERSINCRESKMRIGLRQLVIHGLRSNVLLPEEGTQNQFTLSGELELMLAQMLPQGLHFFYMLIRHNHVSERGLIKDETATPVKGVARARGLGGRN